MDTTWQLAGLAQRVRWATEALSEVSSSLLEMDRSDLSSQAFHLQVELARLHNELLKPLRKAPDLPIPKEPAHRGEERVPF